MAAVLHRPAPTSSRLKVRDQQNVVPERASKNLPHCKYDRTPCPLNLHSRRSFAHSAIIIANVNAPSLADPALNGITVEFEHCKGDQSPHALEQDIKQYGVAPRSSLSQACRQTLEGQKGGR
jgi:hypothetical protein